MNRPVGKRSDVLVERVGSKIVDEVEWDEFSVSMHDSGTRKVLRAIVDELGITREDVTMLKDAAMEWQTHSNPHGHLGLQELADRLTALLEAADDEEPTP